MKILYCHRTQGRGAEGVHITSIINALTALGHRITLVSPPGVDPFLTAGNAPLDKSRGKPSPGIHSLWKLISTRAPQQLFELAEVAYNIYQLPVLALKLAGGYGLVYERYAFFNFSTALASSLFRVPHFIEVNEICGIERARRQKNVWLADRIERFVLKRAAAIFTVSSFLKQRITEKGVDGDRVFVMPNAINPGLFSGRDGGREVRGRLGLEGKVVIGFAGWFDEWDRLQNLISVFARVRGKRPCHLLLIGDGKMMGALKGLAAGLGIEDSVTFTGPVQRSKVLDYIDALDIAVLPHSNEFGSPVVLFEFMGLGKAIVAPGLMPILDVLDDGENALIFKPHDWDGLEKSVAALIEDDALRKRLGEAGKRKVMEEFTWAANAKEILRRRDAVTGKCR